MHKIQHTLNIKLENSKRFDLWPLTLNQCVVVVIYSFIYIYIYVYIYLLSLQAHPDNKYLSPEDLSVLRPVLCSPHYSSRREVVLRGSLPPGRYIIIPSTAEPNKQGAFLLRVLTEQGNAAMWVRDRSVNRQSLDFGVFMPLELGKESKKNTHQAPQTVFQVQKDEEAKRWPPNLLMRQRSLRGLRVTSHPERNERKSYTVIWINIQKCITCCHD